MLQPEPTPDERLAGIPPPRLPPVSRGLNPPPPPGGSSQYRLRRWLLLAIGSVAVLSGLGAAALAVWLVPQRIPTSIGALLGVAVGVYTSSRALGRLDVETSFGHLLLGAIAGAVLGELLRQLVFHLDPGAPKGALWLLVGALGMGGACGVIAVLVANAGIVAVLGAKLLLLSWRTLGKPAA